MILKHTATIPLLQLQQKVTGIIRLNHAWLTNQKSKSSQQSKIIKTLRAHIKPTINTLPGKRLIIKHIVSKTHFGGYKRNTKSGQNPKREQNDTQIQTHSLNGPTLREHQKLIKDKDVVHSVCQRMVKNKQKNKEKQPQLTNAALRQGKIIVGRSSEITYSVYTKKQVILLRIYRSNLLHQLPTGLDRKLNKLS